MNLSVVIITIAACGLFAVNSGIRSNYGIMINAIVENSGVSYSTVSFVLAVAQLMYGIMCPVFGIIALKKSSAFVIRCGIILIIIVLLGVPFAKSIWMFYDKNKPLKHPEKKLEKKLGYFHHTSSKSL